MQQFDVSLYRIGSNVAHKMRHYKCAIASGLVPDVSKLVSDVGKFIPVRVRGAIHMNPNQIRLRRISAFLPAASGRHSAGVSYEEE